MSMTGGCYCGALRYEAGDIMAKAQCSCRECQYFTGGSPNVIAGVAEDSFRYTQGEPQQISGKGGSPTREFCGDCGTHIVARSPDLGGMVMVKVGTLDKPEEFGSPEVAVFTSEAYSWHSVPEGCASFEKFMG